MDKSCLKKYFKGDLENCTKKEIIKKIYEAYGEWFLECNDLPEYVSTAQQLMIAERMHKVFPNFIKQVKDQKIFGDVDIYC